MRCWLNNFILNDSSTEVNGPPHWTPRHGTGADLTFDSLCPLQVRLRPAHLPGLRRVPGRLAVPAVHAGHRHRRLPAAAPHRRQGGELPGVEPQWKLPRTPRTPRTPCTPCTPPQQQSGRPVRTWEAVIEKSFKLTNTLTLFSLLLSVFVSFFFFCLRQFISYVSSKVDYFIDNMCVVCFCFFYHTVACSLFFKKGVVETFWMFRSSGQMVQLQEKNQSYCGRSYW